MPLRLFSFLIMLLLAGLADAGVLILHWEGVLVLFCAWVLAPEALKLAGFRSVPWFLPGAGLLAIACWLTWLEAAKPVWAIGLAAPYLAVTAWYFFRTLGAFSARQPLADWVRLFSMGYWFTGAAWMLAAVAGWQPLGFDPVIVALTAAHFHYAGWIFGLLVERMLRAEPHPLHRLLGLGVLWGMPLVAGGITLTKLGGPGWVEMSAGLLFVALALLLAFRQLALSRNPDYPLQARIWWGLGGFCLVASMVLAGGYALRFVWPLDWFTIPHLKGWHGSLNALGFAFCSLQGWRRAIGQSDR